MGGTNSYLTFDINALILCEDTHFLGTLERVFTKLGVRNERTADYATALAALEQRHIDIVVVDWREIANLGEFGMLGSVLTTFHPGRTSHWSAGLANALIVRQPSCVAGCRARRLAKRMGPRY